jgi:CRP/FNR family cyclic AMP-dependent transcriptional regulator
MEGLEDAQWAVALEGLSRDQRAAIAAKTIRRTFVAHAAIFERGDRGDEVLVVRLGRVRMFYRTSDGQEFTTGIWSSGYVVGLVSALLGKRRALCAESIGSVSMIVLSRADLLRLMEEIPRFAINVARLAALLANDSFKRNGPFALESAPLRLSKVLVKLASRSAHDPPERRVVRGLSQEELGRMVGVSRGWINHTLSSFESRGLITRGRGTITIPNLTRFRQLLISEART